MKLWVDDVRQPPNWELGVTDTWCWATSVNDAKNAIEYYEKWFKVELIDLDTMQALTQMMEATTLSSSTGSKKLDATILSVFIA